MKTRRQREGLVSPFFESDNHNIIQMVSREMNMPFLEESLNKSTKEMAMSKYNEIKENECRFN